MFASAVPDGLWVALGCSAVLAAIGARLAVMSAARARLQAQQIADHIRSLEKTSLNALDKEIQERQAVIDRLQAGVVRYEELTELRRSQIVTIAEMLQKELRGTEDRMSRSSLLQSAAFFFLGVLVAVIVAILTT